MKTRLAVLSAAVVFSLAALLLVSLAGPVRSVHAGGGGCPVDYAAGFYAFNGQSYATGVAVLPAPVATAGAIFITPDSPLSLTGTLSGYYTMNARGTVTRTDFTGTLAMVAGHCYGSATITPTSGFTTHWDLVPSGWSNGGVATEVMFVETDSFRSGTLTAVPM
ncbi:MAG TPA: hypothetical protein VFB69_00640 [Candidatus Dormibacteraeota bacterium]|nr:hypothetical protein [Candidatus Dormibacteraeota bacterium]